MSERFTACLLAFAVALAPLLCCCFAPDASARPDADDASIPAHDCHGHTADRDTPPAPPADDAPSDDCGCHDGKHLATVPDVAERPQTCTTTLPDLTIAQWPALTPRPAAPFARSSSQRPPPIRGADRCLMLGVLLI